MGSFGIGSSTSTTKPVTVANWNSQQQDLFAKLAAQLNKGMSGGVTKYPGMNYVPETEQEGNYFNYVNANSQARQDAINQIMSGKLTASQEASYTPDAANNLYENSIRNPALREYNEITAPSVREEFAGPGYWGGARAEAMSRSSENLASNLASKKAELLYNEATAKRTAEEAALNRQATYGLAAAETGANIEGTAAQYKRSIEQEKVAGDLQRWLAGESINGVSAEQYNPWLQLVYQALGLSPYTIASETEEETTNYGGSGTWGGK